MAVVRGTGLHVGGRRSVGMAALSLRPLDATGGHRLVLGARPECGVQTGRCVLVEERQTGGLGSACAWRKLEASRRPAPVSEREYHLRTLRGGLTRDRSGQLYSASAGAAGDGRVYASAAIAAVSGRAPGRLPSAVARRQYARDIGLERGCVRGSAGATG